MDEILEAFRQVKQGHPSNEIFTYDNINLHFSGNVINVYDFRGEMPCGRYRLPNSEQEMVERVEQLNEKVGDLINNDQFLCGKCGGTFDLPEYKRDRHGAYICFTCANGGDIRETKHQAPKKDIKERETSSVDEKEPTATPTPSTSQRARLTADEAIQCLS